MESSNRSIIIGVAISIAAVVGVVLIILWSIDNRIKRLSASAPVEIINAAPTSWKVSKKTVTGYRISYRFSVNSEVFSAEDTNQYYSPGKKAHICYDAKTPSDHQFVVSDDERCGEGIRYTR